SLVWGAFAAGRPQEGGARIDESGRPSTRYNRSPSIVCRRRRSFLPSPTPRARLRRLALLALPVLAMLNMAHFVQTAARAGAQAEGTVHLAPAMSTVPLSDGPLPVDGVR